MQTGRFDHKDRQLKRAQNRLKAIEDEMAVLKLIHLVFSIFRDKPIESIPLSPSEIIRDSEEMLIYQASSSPKRRSVKDEDSWMLVQNKNKTVRCVWDQRRKIRNGKFPLFFIETIDTVPLCFLPLGA